ncbi:MAG: flagellar hook-length control protein FliK [Epsilonproteobacteria bacterium]|nr:flagellar hook-length control protein FliK [Campylobacterota bacterium]
MIVSSNDKKFNILLPSTNKALAEALKDATVKEFVGTTKGMDLNSILESLFQKSTNVTSKALLELLKTNPTLKDLGNVQTTIKDLLNSIKNIDLKLPIEDKLKEFLVDIKNVDTKVLKENIKNSGIFLESKLLDAQGKQEIDKILSKDLKALLLKTSKEVQDSSHINKSEILKHIDKLSLHIDYYQLMSHLSDSSSLYLPFSWDALQEGNIEIKKVNDDKFYCDINLKLKEYGELNLKLILYEKNQLNIQIYSDDDEFRTTIKDNISSLRSALIELQITPREMRISKMKVTDKRELYNDIFIDDLKMGFEVKI